jgi:hypothetical protein
MRGGKLSDETLSAVANNCPKLQLLLMVGNELMSIDGIIQLLKSCPIRILELDVPIEPCDL